MVFQRRLHQYWRISFKVSHLSYTNYTEHQYQAIDRVAQRTSGATNPGVIPPSTYAHNRGPSRRALQNDATSQHYSLITVMWRGKSPPGSKAYGFSATPSSGGKPPQRPHAVLYRTLSNSSQYIYRRSARNKYSVSFLGLSGRH